MDFPAVLDRARSILMRSRTGLRRDLERTENPRLIVGHARLEGRDRKGFRVRVGNRHFLAREVVLDTGTRTRVPDVPGLLRVDFLHAGNWLDRPELPGHVVFLGAGYVALEMGQLYRRMGSRVTILERSRSLLKAEDEDVTSALQAVLESEGIEFRLGTRVTRVLRRRNGVKVEVAERRPRQRHAPLRRDGPPPEHGRPGTRERAPPAQPRRHRARERAPPDEGEGAVGRG